ncbi:hypothetical protein C2869_00765 [Saccharobesus litoralis]|uniref:HPt domain-containing protein n=2 Tax=Saccharobesus litoralis TaxID=2172099 RepID=A0A2S0VLS4_9ALTE|nr:hypothetical protein C2869_00765 [Saccharobesus litoralis]
MAGDDLFYVKLRALQDSEKHATVNIDAISEFTGNLSKNELNDLLDQYLQSWRAKHQDMQAAVSNEDFKLLKRLSHSLKSSAVCLGAKKVELLALLLERLCDKKNIPVKKVNVATLALLEQLAMVTQKIQQAIQNEH